MRNKVTYDNIKQALNKIGTEMADNYWKYPYPGVRIVFTPLLKKGESIMPNMNTLHVSEEDVFNFYFFHGVTEKSIQAAGNYARQKIHAYIDKLCQDTLINSDTDYFSSSTRFNATIDSWKMDILASATLSSLKEKGRNIFVPATSMT